MKMAIDFVMFFNVASCFFRRFATKFMKNISCICQIAGMAFPNYRFFDF